MAVKKKNEDVAEVKTLKAKGEAETITPEHLEIIKDLQAQVEELKKTVEPISNDPEYVNPSDDYLDDPVVFFAFSSHYSIFGDKKYNREVLPPRGEPIVFDKLYRYKRRAKTGRGVDVVSISQSVVRSEMDLKFLREHSLYGIKFFESINKAKNVNITLAEKMSEMNAVTSNMSDHQIIERAKREGISISNPDIVYIRQMLTKKLAEDAMKQEKTQHIKKMTEPKEIERKINVDVDTETERVYE